MILGAGIIKKKIKFIAITVDTSILLTELLQYNLG